MSLERNMSKVILHLGLPKTATTLLQSNVFTKASDGIDYAGIQQPRNVEQDALYIAIVECISQDEDFFNASKKNVIDNITERFKQLNGRKLVISEECFSVDEVDGCRWQDKYRRLGEVFSHCTDELEILVTTRDPISATYSYYVELYHSIGHKFSTPLDFATKSNYCRIYDYCYLDQVIERSFNKAKVEYIDFSLLKEGRFVDTVISSLGIVTNANFSQPNVNKKKKRQNGVMTHPKSVLTYANNWAIFRLLRKSSMIKSFLRKPAQFVRRINAPGSSKVIPHLTELDKQVLAKHFAESRQFLSQQ